MMLAKVTTKSTLPVMKCLHTSLLVHTWRLDKATRLRGKVSPPANLAMHTIFVYAISVKNITLSADEALIEQARQVAQAQHTTLNAAFREWLLEFTARQRNVHEIRALMDRLKYVKIGRKLTRDEMNER